MSKTKKLNQAAFEIEVAISRLKCAKSLLLASRSSEHMPIALVIANLEESFGILTDPECTPEFYQN
ncbi:hypothetical protein [Paenibacillus sp. YN15]|uniref:hypothetical protein n=1 Tax=Paenibacillus sp. YN15 TaxID=1742774 RepID=UPI000DCC72D2|nr:hypothetical protein [Paenibacillus sp. YN15]RAU92486.1 hypothetical protein DQG13_27540 [Paenibacillus sp. YN15]